MRPWSSCTENIRSTFFISSVGLTACLPWNNGNAAGRLFAACEIIAAVRGDADMKGMQEKISQLEEHFSAKIQLLSFRRIEISSSEIRARRSEGLSVRYLVPETVREYMEEKGLYLDE